MNTPQNEQKKPGTPSHYGDETGTWFKNPWDVVNDEEMEKKSSSWFSMPALPSLFELEFPLQWARDYSGHKLRPPRVVEPDFGRNKASKGNVKATWLGHAGFLVELCTRHDREPPIRIVFDPFFSERAGPSQYASIPRLLPAPCSVNELPEIQYVLISHNHYDHLDLTTIGEIASTHGPSVCFMVPKGMRPLLISAGVATDQILEMDWWEEVSLTVPGRDWESPTNLKFCCVPAQHNSGRGVRDQNTALWCGWVVRQTLDESRTATIYHTGDTGYMTTKGPCPVFKEIGRRYGPIDLSMIPIWRGGSLSFIARLGLRLSHIPYLSALHATPAHAVSVHRDVRSRHSLAMHFGTLAGSEAEAVEPLVELEGAKAQKGEGGESSGSKDWEREGGFGWLDVGETAVLGIF